MEKEFQLDYVYIATAHISYDTFADFLHKKKNKKIREREKMQSENTVFLILLFYFFIEK